MSQPIAAALLSIFCLVGAARTASADGPVGGRTSPADGAFDPRDAPSSLPGVVRVGIPAPNRAGFAAAGTAGYGFTESMLAQSDKHNRMFGSVAASFRPNDWFAAALRID